jgi:3-isopropylmalate/(R)-2-methylmalate dehydratase large subunit
MGMTITEKILAYKSGKPDVAAGDMVVAEVDLACVDEIQIALFEEAFEQLNCKVWDNEKACVVVDHYLPPATIDQAQAVKKCRDFGFSHDLKYIFLHQGIKHQLLFEKGLVLPGDVLVATDSHTNTLGAVGAFAVGLGPTEVAGVFKEGKMWFRVPETVLIQLVGKISGQTSAKDIALKMMVELGSDFARYKAIEFTGEAVYDLSIEQRFVLCNFTTEMGAKNGVIAPDDLVIQSAKAIGRQFKVFESDSDASFHERKKFNVTDLEPLIALPHHPTNVVRVLDTAGKRIDQAFVGTCTNGNLEDLRVAAKIMAGKHVKPWVRCLIVPATMKIYRQAMVEGLLQAFSEAGAIVCNPNCGPCAGLHQGTLAASEVMISTQNRNFKGRAGHSETEIYLASPATVAASAVAGVITDPRTI